MKNSKIPYLIAALAVAGLVQVASAGPVFPTSPGLFLYDEATGATNFVPITSGVATVLPVVTFGDYTINAAITGQNFDGVIYPILDLSVDSVTAGAGAGKLDVYFFRRRVRSHQRQL